MADTPSQLFIGTAGWSYPDWTSAVYPATNPAERLRTVARYLDCVEINSSFYRPPTPRTTANWLHAVVGQPRFRFLAKAWQRFTHERQTPWTPAELHLMTDGLQPLREAEKLDAVLFQFPWSFRHDAVNLAWLDRVAEAFAGWPAAVELRHDSWATPDVPEFFRTRGLIYCNIDQPLLNHCLPPTALATTPTGYFRLHGRNAANWFRRQQETYGGRYDHLYSAGELDEVVKPITALSRQTRKTFVVFNNHKDGKAFANALQLKARVAPGQSLRAPATLLDRFPVLNTIAQRAGDEQLPLV